MGSNGQQRAARVSGTFQHGAQGNKKPRLSGAFRERMMGLEPTTFCMASRRSSQLSYIREAASIASVFCVQSLVHEPVGQLVVGSTHGGVAHSGKPVLQI